MPVSDVARTDVVTASRAQTAGNLATVMSEEEVGSVVITDERKPVGIVTDRDLVVEVLEPRRDPKTTTAGDVMTESPATVTATEGVFEATRAMHDNTVRRMPVVDDEGNVAGIVTLDDLLVLLTDELDNLASVIESESPPY
ncbi:CBS domain-containing protein [Halorarius halobius]|uniref:CBS domain-containing protein n=1 Tax=Halorarius halobius TaxID=2962671 RepID=UPI0020CDFF1D|nr:CBS domain-containing protein [Halorarius halobius]